MERSGVRKTARKLYNVSASDNRAPFIYKDRWGWIVVHRLLITVVGETVQIHRLSMAGRFIAVGFRTGCKWKAVAVATFQHGDSIVLLFFFEGKKYHCSNSQ